MPEPEDASVRTVVVACAANLLIGVLLVAVAFLLVRRNGALLIDQAAPADVRKWLRRAVADELWVADVPELTAVYVGPKRLLVLADVVPADGAELAANVERLRRRLLAVPAVTRAEITPIPHWNEITPPG
jgi:divalent metal cation (Fe/Co/Zn/Cd) transporter